jgi:amidohydrolase
LLEEGLWNAAQLARDARSDRLGRLSAAIHANPEEGWAEVKAARWLGEYLAEEGFRVTAPAGGIATAFLAEWSQGSGRPALAYLAEYDALPELGHACGHNLIGAAAAGAGATLRQVMLDTGLEGKVLVLGTPAEEVGGGKLKLLEAGMFRGLDAVLMMHPATSTRVGGTSLALTPIRFAFQGKAAHAAASPHEGINALDAVIQTFNSVNALRQHVTEDVRLHGIITRGGVAPNIVPDAAEAYFYVRAGSIGVVRSTLERLENCARAAALATGASLAIHTEDSYLEIIPNAPLEQCLLQALTRAGVSVEPTPETGMRGSTDFGNVSRACPSAAFTIAIAPREVAVHSPEFAAASASPAAETAMHEAVLVLAAAGLSLASDRALVAAAHAAHTCPP